MLPKRVFLLFLFVAECVLCHNSVRDIPSGLGALPIVPTVGQVWPQPQAINSKPTLVSLDPLTFEFVNNDGCEVIDNAFDRYKQLIFYPARVSTYQKYPEFNHLNFLNFANESLRGQLRGQLPSLTVTLNSQCETWPTLYMDEQYQLKIDTDEIPLQGALIATTVWGVLRGLETFSQLIFVDPTTHLYVLNSTFILDFPRFTHRGILLDSSRHFVPLHVIKDNLDAMAYNKFNVFHWHIVDDQSFPYQSQLFPNMSQLGAYDPINHIYTFDNVRDVFDYARLRGIRVVPEFDTPGHTLSWGKSILNLLTQCYDNTTKQPNGLGPVDPSQESSYDFLSEFFGEVATLFPDQYVHLGGDEVPFDCWQSNPAVNNFMLENNLTTYQELESYYIGKVLNIVDNLNKSSIVWQEVFDNGVQMSEDTIIQVWKSGEMLEMSRVTQAGFRAVLSSCWYLDYINHIPDWQQFYLCEPEDFQGTSAQYSLVTGGEACLWGEYVDASNLMSRMWPRASAAGERLWSNRTVTDTKAAAPRLEALRCRMMQRGLDPDPQTGPGFCDTDYLM